MEQWISALEKVIHAQVGEEEVKKKVDAALQLEPILKKNLRIAQNQFKAVIQALQEAGLMSADPSGKLKEGHLEMQKSEGKWKKYYFLMFKHAISYFNLDEKQIPRGVISIESIFSMTKDPISNTNNIPSVSEDKSSQNFKSASVTIYTPIRTFYLRAKHEAAMDDWIISIDRLRHGSHEKSPVTRDELIEGEPVAKGKKIQLLYMEVLGGKQKVFKMKKNNIIIGRSSKADLVLAKDQKVSRNHCRIELTPSGIPVLYDLGSQFGSKVNNVKQTKVSIKDGDSIKLGDSVIVFQVK